MPPGIDNLLQFIRMQRLFDPNREQEAPSQGSPIQFGQQEQVNAPMPLDMAQAQPIDPMERLKALYNPEHRASDKQWELYNSMPNREDYKPSLLRKIGTGIVGGFHGAKAGQDFYNSPYNQAQSDWKAKFDPLSKIADDERASNNLQRQYANQVGIDLDRDRRLDISEKRANSYAALNQFKMDHPDWKVLKQEGGNYLYFNPATREMLDSGVKTGTLDQATEIAMRIQGQKEVAAIPRTTNTTGATTSVTVTPPGAEPGQDKIAQYNRAKEAASNPQWAGLITFDGTNEFTLAVPASGASADEWTKYKDAYRHIYQKQPMFDQTPLTPQSSAGQPTVPAQGNNTRTTTTNRNSTSTTQRGNQTQSQSRKLPPAPKAPKGWKYVPNADGTAWTAVKE